MKRSTLTLVIGAFLFIGGFFGGRISQDAKTGYQFKVREQKEFESPMGLIRWIYATESVGVSILDPGTTIIELDGKTIYKAKRAFQEGAPFARNIVVSGQNIILLGTMGISCSI